MSGYAAQGLSRGLLAGLSSGGQLFGMKNQMDRQAKEDAWSDEVRGRTREKWTQEDADRENARAYAAYIDLITNEDGSPKKPEEVDLNSPRVREIANHFDEFKGLFTAGENVDPDEPFAGLIPIPQEAGGGYAAQLYTRGPDGKRGTAPLTMLRSADKVNDPHVRRFTHEELLDGLRAGFAAKGFSSKVSPEEYRKAKAELAKHERDRRESQQDELAKETRLAEREEAKYKRNRSDKLADEKTAHGRQIALKQLDATLKPEGKTKLVQLKTGHSDTLDNLRQAYQATYGKSDGMGGFTRLDDAPTFEQWVNAQAVQPVFSAPEGPTSNVLAQARQMAEKWADSQAGWLSSDQSDFKAYGGNREQAIAEKTQEFAAMLQGAPAQGLTPQVAEQPAIPPGWEPVPGAIHKGTGKPVYRNIQSGKMGVF